jgi:hypothetical protein
MPPTRFAELVKFVVSSAGPTLRLRTGVEQGEAGENDGGTDDGGGTEQVGFEFQGFGFVVGVFSGVPEAGFKKLPNFRTLVM